MIESNDKLCKKYMSEIIEQTKLLKKEEVEKIREEFEKQSDLIKGNSFSDLLDNVDKHIPRSI